MIPGISRDGISPVLRLKAECRYLRASERLFALHSQWERNPEDTSLGHRTTLAVDELDNAAALCQELGVDTLGI